LEEIYTGKAFGALIDDKKGQRLRGKVMLFWNTSNLWLFEGIES
jgi:hypothetical protein